MSQDKGGIDRQLALEVEAAIGVLGDPPETRKILRDVQDLPPRILQRELRAAIVEQGFTADEAERVAAASLDIERAAAIAPAVMASLRSNGALSEHIGAAAANREELMAVDPVTIGLAVLILLALRTNRIQISNKGIEVNLQPLKSGIVQAALTLLNA